MGTKYCDHGAYGFGTFNGYISNTANNDNGTAGNTLTVTGVTAGIINIGSQISGGGLPSGYVVAAFVSGTRGGAGVYTVRRVPIDSTVVLRATTGLTAINGLPLVTPLAWGVPQEGDGTAKTAATTSATTSWDLSAATAAAGATISVMGATLTCVASGATNNQFNAGTGTTLINNIVTAINRAGNTVTVAAQASGWRTPKVQDAVFARITGNNLEVMTRAGSATYNGLTAMTHTGLTGTVPANPTWSGGSGGCWGYLFNSSGTIWPSAIAANSYSFFANNHLAGFVGDTTSGGEDVYIRSGKTIFQYLGSSMVFPAFSATGSAAKPVNFIFDAGVEWADGSNPQIRITATPNTSGQLGVIQAAGVGNISVNFLSPKYADGTYGIVASAAPNALGPTAAVSIAASPGVRISGIEIDAQTDTTSGINGGFAAISLPYNNGGANGYTSVVHKCKLRSKNNASFFVTSTSALDFEIFDIDCDGTDMSVPLTRAFSFSSAHGSSGLISFENIRFNNLPNLSNAFDPADTCNAAMTVVMSNISWGTLKNKGPIFPGAVNSRALRYVSAFSSYGGRDFSFDSPVIFYDWDSNGAYPTLNAKLLDGITPWSMRVVPSRTTGAITQSTAGELPRIAKIIPAAVDLAEGVRTVNVEFLVEQSLSFSTKDMSLLICYQDTSGNVVTHDTFDPFGSAFTASTAAWSGSSSSSQVTWAGSVVLNKYKISTVTPSAVKAGSEMSIYVRFHSKVTSTTQAIFVDPEIVVQ